MYWGDLCREACQDPRPILATMHGNSPKKSGYFYTETTVSYFYDSEYGVLQQTNTEGPLPPIF
jgi:hypothetical protein